MTYRRVAVVLAATALLVVSIPSSASAATPGIGDVSDAMRYGPTSPLGTPLAPLSGLDDQVTTVAAPFPLNFFGEVSNGLCISTNGGLFPVPTGADGCSAVYDRNLENLAIASHASIIAALGADVDPGMCVDTTPDGFGVPCAIYFEPAATVDGRDALVVTWYRVPMNDSTNVASLSATFQIVIIKRATGDDTVGWDFDIEFNFGTATDMEDGYSAAVPSNSCNSMMNLPDCRWGVGWARYDSVAMTATPSELFAATPISDLVDGGATPLVANSLNSAVPGRYSFAMVSGATTGFTPPTMAAPVPVSGGGLALTGTDTTEGLAVAAAMIVLGAAFVFGSRTRARRN